MSIIKSDDNFFDHYVNGGSILEFKCLFHSKQRIEDSAGELAGYTRDFIEQNQFVHVRIMSGGYIRRERYPEILALLYPPKTDDCTYYYSDFEFVRAIRVDNEVLLK